MMTLWKDLKSGKYNLVLFSVIFILILILFLRRKKESMANTSVDSQIEQAVKQIYATDVEALRNLSNLARKMINDNSVTIPSNVFVNGQLVVGQKDVSDGVITVLNKNGGIGVYMNSNDPKLGGSIYLYEANNTDKTGSKPGNSIHSNTAVLNNR